MVEYVENHSSVGAGRTGSVSHNDDAFSVNDGTAAAEFYGTQGDG